MRGFTERNPMIIGSVVIALIAVGTVGSLFLNAGVLADRYTLVATFSDSAGLEPGDAVRVAGVRSGQVAAVEAAGDRVAARLVVDEGVELSRDTRAEIVVETLLGQKYVRLTTGRNWATPLRDGDVIENGRTPTEVLDLQNIGTPLLEETDAEAMNEVLERLAAITDGKREQVATIVDGLGRLTSEVNRRQTETRSLLEAANRLSSTLASRDEELVRAVDNLNVVVSGLADRRSELVRMLGETRAAARLTADLVGDNRARFDAVLDELSADLAIVGRHQVDLAQSVAYLAAAIEGFSSIGYSAGGVPNEWANIFTQLVTPHTVDPVLGSCGPLDQALDAVLGPDPLPCDERNGPSTVPPDGEVAGAAGTAGQRGSRRPVAGRTDLERSLTLLLAPVLEVGR